MFEHLDMSNFATLEDTVKRLKDRKLAHGAPFFHVDHHL